jgi:hypothetical protein
MLQSNVFYSFSRPSLQSTEHYRAERSIWLRVILRCNHFFVKWYAYRDIYLQNIGVWYCTTNEIAQV